MHADRKIDVPFRTQHFVILAVQAGSFHMAARASGIDRFRTLEVLHYPAVIEVSFSLLLHKFAQSVSGWSPDAPYRLKADAYMLPDANLTRTSIEQ